ncbi:MAG: TOPRIM nucleotidyl transferase/hydrolase domain-containing protein, partial [Bacteroidaceae bacterium]|nr:TOPRIM nucleotidyl transferase/hydrolase domain-containing protein [Bacteroidaceae bacterium]
NLKVTYLKPLRDALTELTPGYKSRIAQILGGHNIFKSKPTNNPEEKWKHELENKAKEANDVIRTYFKPSTEKNINEIKEELEIFSQYVNSKKDCIEEKEIKGLIDQFKQTFDKIKCGDKTSNEGAEITKQVFDNLKALSFDETINDPAFEITDEELSDILKTLKLVNDSNKAGLGSLNRLYMAAEFLLLSQSKGRELQLALIEEIEAHLHPQAQLKVIDALQNDDHLKKGQKILTTHSTTLASKVKLNNLLLCHNKDVYSMFNDEKHTRLGVGDYEFLERFLDATKANLFFAKGVIMVEGDAENLLIPAIAEIIDRPLQNYGVSIVNVGSTAFMRYAKIFQRNDNKILGIYVACVRDLDIKQTIDKNGKVITPKRKSGKEEYTPHVESEIEKKKEIEDDAVLVFTSPLWTLEHDLLNSDEITRQLLLQSILEAQLIQNREDQKNYKSINEEDEIKKKMISEKILDKYKEEGKANNWIACKIYSKYLDNNRVSKTITAQRFAYHLLKNKSKVKNIIQNATEFEYIRDTIYFVTKDSES